MLRFNSVPVFPKRAWPVVDVRNNATQTGQLHSDSRTDSKSLQSLGPFRHNSEYNPAWESRVTSSWLVYHRPGRFPPYSFQACG